VDPEQALATVYMLANTFGVDYFVPTADQDFPEHGLTKGQRFVALDRLEQFLGWQAQQALRGREAVAAAQKEAEAAAARALEAERKNAAALRSAAGGIPPAAPVGGTPTPSAETKKPGSRDEWLKQLNAELIAPGFAGA
jgi:hypothetical protein